MCVSVFLILHYTTHSVWQHLHESSSHSSPKYPHNGESLGAYCLPINPPGHLIGLTVKLTS